MKFAFTKITPNKRRNFFNFMYFFFPVKKVKFNFIKSLGRLWESNLGCGIYILQSIHATLHELSVIFSRDQFYTR